MNIRNLKTQYLEYLEIEKNRSQKTLENYNRYLERFLTFLKPTALDTIDAITEESIRQYRLNLNRIKDNDGKPLKRVTQNYHIIALRNFLKYLAKRNIKSVAAEKIELG